MGHQHPVSHKVQKFWQDLLDLRGALEHLLGDAGQLHNPPVQGPLRVHKGLEPIQLLPIFQNHRADLDNPVRPGGQSRGFQIEGHKFLIEGHIFFAMDHDPVVHVVDIIPFAAVQDLDGLVGARHLGGLLPLHTVQRVGKGLAAAVVRNGDGLVAPGGGLLDGGGGVGQGVHVGHDGVQVQLHPLVPRGGVPALGHGAGHHGIGLEDHLIFKPVLHQPALDPQNAAQLYVFQDGLCLSLVHKAADADGVGVVGHVELYHPGVPLFQLLVLHLEHLALHDHRAHVHGQVLHGGGIPPEELPVEGVLLLGLFGLFLLLAEGCGGQGLKGGGAHGLHGLHQRLSFQLRAGLHGDGHRRGKSLPQLPLHGGNLLQNCLFPVGTEADGQGGILPLPFGPGQGAPGHGVPADEKVHQLRVGHFADFLRRMGGRHRKISQTIEGRQILHHPVQVPLGEVGLGVDDDGDGPALRVHVSSNEGRLRKGCSQLLRRLVFGEHLKKSHIRAHSFSIRLSRAGSSSS